MDPRFKSPVMGGGLDDLGFGLGFASRIWVTQEQRDFMVREGLIKPDFEPCGTCGVVPEMFRRGSRVQIECNNEGCSQRPHLDAPDEQSARYHWKMRFAVAEAHEAKYPREVLDRLFEAGEITADQRNRLMLEVAE